MHKYGKFLRVLSWLSTKTKLETGTYAQVLKKSMQKYGSHDNAHQNKLETGTYAQVWKFFVYIIMIMRTKKIRDRNLCTSMENLLRALSWLCTPKKIRVRKLCTSIEKFLCASSWLCTPQKIRDRNLCTSMGEMFVCIIMTMHTPQKIETGTYAQVWKIFPCALSW